MEALFFISYHLMQDVGIFDNLDNESSPMIIPRSCVDLYLKFYSRAKHGKCMTNSIGR